MECENCLALIDDLVEGELAERFAEQVNLHLFACRDCAAKYTRLLEEKGIYSHYFFDIEPPSDLAVKIQSQLTARHKEISKTAAAETFNWTAKISRFIRFYPAAACLLLLFVIGFALLRF